MEDHDFGRRIISIFVKCLQSGRKCILPADAVREWCGRSGLFNPRSCSCRLIFGISCYTLLLRLQVSNAIVNDCNFCIQPEQLVLQYVFILLVGELLHRTPSRIQPATLVPLCGGPNRCRCRPLIQCKLATCSKYREHQSCREHILSSAYRSLVKAPVPASQRIKTTYV